MNQRGGSQLPTQVVVGASVAAALLGGVVARLLLSLFVDLDNIGTFLVLVVGTVAGLLVSLIVKVPTDHQ